MSIICDPEIYVSIFRKHGQVYHLGTNDVEVRDWKEQVSKCIKPPGSWHFKFNPTKRFLLFRGRQNVKIQGEEAYRSNIGQPKYVTKKNKTCSDCIPVILPRGNKVNEKKISDVTNLLNKHFGDDWRNLDTLKYYKDIEANNNSFESHENMQCVAIEENENFI